MIAEIIRAVCESTIASRIGVHHESGRGWTMAIVNHCDLRRRRGWTVAAWIWGLTSSEMKSDLTVSRVGLFDNIEYAPVSTNIWVQGQPIRH